MVVVYTQNETAGEAGGEMVPAVATAHVEKIIQRRDRFGGHNRDRRWAANGHVVPAMHFYAKL